MKVYKVKVNGKVYEVELESVSEQAGKIEAPVQAAPQAAPQAAQPSHTGRQAKSSAHISRAL